MLRAARVWGAIGLAWTALAVLVGISLWLNYLALGREARFGASLIVSLAEWWLWALLTPIPVFLARRWPLTRPRLARHILLHLGAGFVVAGVKVLAERLVRIWIFGAAPYLLPSSLGLHWLVYFGIVALTIAADYYRNARARELDASRMDARLQEARLQVLAAQLQPHFLFNAFNTIAETIHEDPHRADRMIGALGDLLRATLDVGGHTAPLAREIGLADRYLAIQHERFGDRLTVSWDVEPGLEAWPVPRLLLQPLLENAIRHGVSARREAGRIRIRARRAGPALDLSVDDDGAGFDDGHDREARGIGLSNTRVRLAAMYGEAASLTMGRSDLGGASVRVVVPGAPL